MVPRSVLVLSGALLILACGGEEKGEKKAEVKPEGPETAQVAKTTGPEDLANRKGCFACHGIREKKVGPAYVDVAKRYSGKEGAVDELVKSILKGSMGKWGSIPMAPQPVSQEEARTLAEWILSLK
ncbi:MAG: c-type cytochrome [Aquificota bacterium]|nr:c-type cytochrome [Aquificota bacterium]